MNTALRTQYVPIEKHWDSTDGIMRVEAIARSSGVLKYRTDKGDRFEFVPQEMIDLRDENDRPAMGWLGGAPLTNEHPPQVIRHDAATRKNYQVGKVSEEMHIYNDADGERVVKVRFDVSDPVTQQQIRSGEKTGVSLGYMCKVDSAVGEYKGKAYTHIQSAPFEIDHLAIVANPRNPGAVITRFDSDDVGVAIGEAVLGTAIEVIRVDSGCSCEHSGDDEDDESVKKKKKKAIRTDSNMIPVTFHDSSQLVDLDTLNQLHEDGVIDRVRLDGKDFFVGADVALDLRNDGIIEMDEEYHYDGFVKKAGIAKGGGKCGRGWVGVKGSCKRLGKGADRDGAQKAALKDFAAGQRSKKAPASMAKKAEAKRDPMESFETASRVKKNVMKSKNMRTEAGKTYEEDHPSSGYRSEATAKALDRRARKTGESKARAAGYRGSSKRGGDDRQNPRIQREAAAKAEAAKTPSQRRSEAKAQKDFEKATSAAVSQKKPRGGKRSSFEDLFN